MDIDRLRLEMEIHAIANPSEQNSLAAPLILVLPLSSSMMPEIQVVPAAAPSLLLFEDDDDGFGDFKFAPSVNPQQDDGWGDFVSTPLESQPSDPPTPPRNPSSSHFDPFPDPASAPPPAAPKAWERHRGALPLSIFGDEEAEKETAPASLGLPDSLFIDGFSSPSAKSAKGIGSGSKGDIKDLIVNLYGQAPAVGNGAGPDPAEGDDDIDWEFKDAFSPSAGFKKEEKVSEIPWFVEKAEANGNGTKVVDNRTGESQEATVQLRVGNIEQDMFDVYVAHDGLRNGFNFGSVVDYNHCISETNQQIKDINNGNGLQPSLENGDKSDDENCWEFKDPFSKVEDLTISLGYQGTGNIPENKLGDLSAPYSNGKKDPGVLSEEHNGTSCEPSYVGIKAKDFNFCADVAFNDILSNLYDKPDQVYNGHPAQIPSEDGPRSAEIGSCSIAVTGDSEFDETPWVFQVYNVHPAQTPSYDGPRSAEIGSCSIAVNGDSEFDETPWEFQKDSVTKVGDQNFATKLDSSLSIISTQNSFMDLYCRLKEECLFLIVHHLNDFKKAHEVADISDEPEKVMKINEEVQVAYKMIQEAMISENAYIRKHASRDVCVTQLLDVMKEPHFQGLVQEYCLQERIVSAEKDLMAAMKLFKHAISVLEILGSASKEEQCTYIAAWSKVAVACSQELQHGAMIWAESLRANLSTEILSRGNQYFVALGEIYRVVEILRASLKLYKPWILFNYLDTSEVLTCLEKCMETWAASGLEKALESISNASTLEHEGRAKSLIESIRLIHDLDEFSLRKHDFGHGKIICRLSLLPVGVLQDMGTVIWNGEHYYLKLANFWVNRISCSPPQLPQIHVR